MVKRVNPLRIKTPFFRTNIDEKMLLAALAQHQSRYSNGLLAEAEGFLSAVFSFKSVFFTKSGTHALELALSSLQLPMGSEIILPSYAFVALGNAVVMNGCKCIFIDCDPSTMNVSYSSIEAEISPNTKAVICINYAGIACDYTQIVPLCHKHGLYLIEDNAHGFGSFSGNRSLGTFGDLSILSFDHMKNFSCQEGGALIVNNISLKERIGRAYFNGTNRKDFEDGKVTKYEWVTKGSNYRLAPLLVALLQQQFDQYNEHIEKLRDIWHQYLNLLSPFKKELELTLPALPANQTISGHIFWCKLPASMNREHVISFLKDQGIEVMSHYVPLHSSLFGHKAGKMDGDDAYTTSGSQQILRLPIYSHLTEEEVVHVADALTLACKTSARE